MILKAYGVFRSIKGGFGEGIKIILSVRTWQTIIIILLVLSLLLLPCILLIPLAVGIAGAIISMPPFNIIYGLEAAITGFGDAIGIGGILRPILDGLSKTFESIVNSLLSAFGLSFSNIKSVNSQDPNFYADALTAENDTNNRIDDVAKKMQNSESVAGNIYKTLKFKDDWCKVYSLMEVNKSMGGSYTAAQIDIVGKKIGSKDEILEFIASGLTEMASLGENQKNDLKNTLYSTYEGYVRSSEMNYKPFTGYIGNNNESFGVIPFFPIPNGYKYSFPQNEEEFADANINILAKKGTLIISPESGKIVGIGKSKSNENNYIIEIVNDDGNRKYVFNNLGKYSPKLQENFGLLEFSRKIGGAFFETVVAGEVIGYVSDDGKISFNIQQNMSEYFVGLDIGEISTNAKIDVVDPYTILRLLEKNKKQF